MFYLTFEESNCKLFFSKNTPLLSTVLNFVTYYFRDWLLKVFNTDNSELFLENFDLSEVLLEKEKHLTFYHGSWYPFLLSCIEDSFKILYNIYIHNKTLESQSEEENMLSEIVEFFSTYLLLFTLIYLTLSDALSKDQHC